MAAHLQKVLAHAERQLVPTRQQPPSEVLTHYRKFLKIEEHRLRLRHRAGAGGRDICQRRADLVDVLLRQAFDAAVSQAGDLRPEQLALIALGGYGRGELNPHSDIDLMFLHDASGNAPDKLTATVEQVLYLLWDIGFKVGHSTRSIPEAIRQANTDTRTKTAMLESRFLAGNEKLSDQFREQFRWRCVAGFERDYVEKRMEDQEARHAKHDNSVYVQEPHVKSGCGGLRDYQNLLWMTYFREGALSTKPLVGRDWLSEPDRRALDRAYDFLLRVRTELHYSSDRANDILHLNIQDQLAASFGYIRKEGVLRSEAFMKDYYGHTRNVFRVTERITAQLARGESSGPLGRLLTFLPSSKAKATHFDGFHSIADQLCVDDPAIFTAKPPQLMRAFLLAQERRLDLSPELEDLFTRRLRLVTRAYQYAAEPRQIFRTILSRPGEVGRVLRLMHRVDFLGRYLPEFGALTCLVQHEFFHRYTADEHTLVCIDKLDELMRTEDPKLVPYRKLLENLENPAVLYLALLLHDTGKAVGARPHAEASALFAHRVARRLQLSADERKTLILLVDHHLTLSSMAQQRNLDDPQTAIEFADVVRNQPTLDALMLLTLADGQGTSADSWSDWKELLVWDLYRATSQYLADQRAFLEKRHIERQTLQEEVSRLLPPDFAEEIEAHFEFLPDNYFRAFPVKEIAGHIHLLRDYLASLYEGGVAPLIPTLRWEPFPRQGSTVVTFCSVARARLLEKIAGSFAVVPLNILSADIYSREDHLVLNVFRVCTSSGNAVTDTRDIAHVEMTLGAALEDATFEFVPLLNKARRRLPQPLRQEVEFPTRIHVDNRAHPGYTLLQVEARDRVGLLFDLLSCLDREGISIALSRISTDKGAAIDTFYVVDAKTRGKITETSRLSSLQQALKDAAVRLRRESAV